MGLDDVLTAGMVFVLSFFVDGRGAAAVPCVVWSGGGDACADSSVCGAPACAGSRVSAGDGVCGVSRIGCCCSLLITTACSPCTEAAPACSLCLNSCAALCARKRAARSRARAVLERTTGVVVVGLLVGGGLLILLAVGLVLLLLGIGLLLLVLLLSPVAFLCLTVGFDAAVRSGLGGAVDCCCSVAVPTLLDLEVTGVGSDGCCLDGVGLADCLIGARSDCCCC